MSSYPLLKTRKAVENFFYRTGYVKFTLYAGHENTPSKSLHTSKDEELSQDAAWEILENILKDHDWKGDYFLFMTDSKNGTGGGKQERIRLDGTGENATNGGASVAGVAGFVQIDQVQGMIKAALMEKENQELKAQIAGGLRPQYESNRLWDFVEKVIEEKDNDHPIVQGIADIGKGLKYWMFKAANGGRSESMGNPDIKDDKTAQNTEGGKKWQFGKMKSVFDHIEKLFPDDEPQDVCVALIKQLYNFKEEERAFFIDELKKTMSETAKKTV
jgi:hypothetical protein